MRGTRITLVIGLVLAVFAFAGCGGDDEASDTETTDTTATDTTGTGGGTLMGSVGPGFEISLTNEDGSAVESLPAGSYTIEVNDQSDIHNFHLTGTGVDEATEVAEVETETFNVTFEAGTYTYVCDPHASQMTGSFEVT